MLRARIAAALRGESAFAVVEGGAAVPPTPAPELGDLPPGAVVVWGRTAASPDGHISVALGDGREASDHIDQQRTHLRGYTNYRVFFPVD